MQIFSFKLIKYLDYKSASKNILKFNSIVFLWCIYGYFYNNFCYKIDGDLYRSITIFSKKKYGSQSYSY